MNKISDGKVVIFMPSTKFTAKSDFIASASFKICFVSFS